MSRISGWLVLLMASLVAGVTFGQTPVLKARNASQELLLTPEDYLVLLPAGDFTEQVRKATKASNALNSFRENWPTKSGNYHLNFEHKSDGLVLTCYLTVATTEQEAKRVAEESLAGWIAGVSKNNKVQATPIEGLDALNKNGRFYLIKLDNGAPFANLFAVREARNVLVVFLRGPVLAGDPDAVTRLLAPKVPKLMAFTPSF